MTGFLVNAIVNGLMSGAIYALIAMGLTLIYGVLHIINFAHGSLLMLGMYVVFLLATVLGVDPYAALPVVGAGGFVLGYALYRGVIGRFSHGKDENILLITLGLSIILENAALFVFSPNTNIIRLGYTDDMLIWSDVFIPYTKAISFAASLVLCAVLSLYISRSDMGKAIRAVAVERRGARLVGINVDTVYALSYGLGTACLGAAACLLMPSYYVSPTVGHSFVLIAFTVVVLGGMGSFMGALVGGLLIGVAESVSGAFLGEQLGQIAIPVCFILVLLFKPTGLFKGSQ